VPLKPFVDTHVHSHFSLLDGVTSPADNVKRAKALGMPAIAVSDHGTVAGIYEHYNACKKEGLVPLLGNELYFKLTLKDGDKDRKYFHGVFLAMNEVGYKNLLKLSSIGYRPDHYEFGRPVVSVDEILANSDGLVYSTGCMIGIVGVAQRRQLSFEESDALFARFADVFRGRMFVEMGPAQVCTDWKKLGEDTKEYGFIERPYKNVEGEGVEIWTNCLQVEHNLRAQRLALKHNLPTIIASDAHMADPALKPVQDMLISGASNNRFHFHQVHAMLSSDETWAMIQQNHPYIVLPQFEGMIENTHQIVDLCKDFKLKFASMIPTYIGSQANMMDAAWGGQHGQVDANLVPSLSVGSNHPLYQPGMSSRDLMLKIIEANGRMRYGDPVYESRLEEEIRVICDNGVTNYTDYFLILADIVRAAKDRGVGTGPARGSAGGCLLSYLLGITAIDPIKWNLNFTRFLNEGRLKAGSPPDIDLDFSDREKMVDYVFERYGEEHAAMVGSFLTIKTKNALKDIARWKAGGHLPENDPVHRITATIKSAPQFYPGENAFLHGFTDADGIAWPGHLEENKVLREYLDENQDVKDLLYKILEKPRSMGKHAGGVVITPGPIDETIPTRYYDNRKCTQISYKQLEKIGGMKIDLLGVNTLNWIWDAVKLIKERHGVDIDPWNLEEEQAVFEPTWIGQSDTIFQFDTHLVSPFLRRIKPRRIHDLILITSICRPGGLDSTLEDGKTVAEHFVLRYSGKEPVSYLDPILEPILGDTYGLVVFQEQIQKIFEVVGGLDPVASDNARRAVGKKDLALINSIKGSLIEGAARLHGWDAEKAQKLWESFIGAANYSFNRAHACAYAIIAYACAWLKFHYPAEWWVSVLTSSSTDDIKRYLNVVHDQVQLPHVNSPAARWTIRDSDHKLLAPLSLVKGMGPKAVAHLEAKVAVGGPFQSFDDFYRRAQGRVLHKGIIMSMCFADCFKGLPAADGGAPQTETAPFIARLHELRKESLPAAFVDMSKTSLIRKKMTVMSIYSVDLTKEFESVLMERTDYEQRSGLTMIAKRPLIANFSKFPIVAGKFQGEIAILGMVLEKDSFTFLAKSGRDEGKRVTAYRVTIVNDGRICEIVIWPSMARRLDLKAIQKGSIILGFGPLKFDTFKGAIGFSLNNLEILDV